MKKILMLSGKGGTGKTTLAGAFIHLSEAKAYGDCDVDAPNLHLIKKETAKGEKETYYGLPKAVISQDACISCGLCEKNCRFHAISHNPGYSVDPAACEGCALCEVLCPAKAIAMEPVPGGEMLLYKESQHVFSTARLKMGQGTTGLLVSQVKKRLDAAAYPDTPLEILDGSPGIGCPVIASVTGTDLVILVAEPSLSGISDLKRVADTAWKLGVPAALCINKADASPRHTEAIIHWGKEAGLPFLGTVPYDPAAIQAVNDGKAITEVSCPAGEAARILFKEAMKLLEEPAS